MGKWLLKETSKSTEKSSSGTNEDLPKVSQTESIQLTVPNLNTLEPSDTGGHEQLRKYTQIATKSSCNLR